MKLEKQTATRSASWWVGLFIIAFVLLLVIASFQYDAQSRFFPLTVSVFIIVMIAVHTISSLIKGVYVETVGLKTAANASINALRLRYALWAFGLFIAIYIIGVHMALPLFILIFIGVHTRNWIAAAILAVFMGSFSYLLLYKTMNILFPSYLIRDLLIKL